MSAPTPSPGYHTVLLHIYHTDSCHHARSVTGCIIASAWGSVYILTRCLDLHDADPNRSWLELLVGPRRNAPYRFSLVSGRTGSGFVLLRAQLNGFISNEEIPPIAPIGRLRPGGRLTIFHADANRLTEAEGACRSFGELEVDCEQATGPLHRIENGTATTSHETRDGLHGAPVFNLQGEYEGMVHHVRRTNGLVEMFTVYTLWVFLDQSPEFEAWCVGVVVQR